MANNTIDGQPKTTMGDEQNVSSLSPAMSMKMDKRMASDRTRSTTT